MGKFRKINWLMRKVLKKDTMQFLEHKYNKFLKKLKKFLYGHTLIEHSYGEKNGDKRFYIIGKEINTWGILTSYAYFMQECKWAIDHKYIPVIDLKNNYMAMSQNIEMAYKENAWEYYFEQPYPEYSLKEVYESKHVVKGTYCENSFADTFNDYGIQVKDFNRYSPFVRKYLDFQPYLWKRAHKFLEKRIPFGKKVLALNMRAGFLWGQELSYAQFANHPISLSLDEYINIAKHYLSLWKYDYIFVATEDREWYEQFQGVFGEKFLRFERARDRFFRSGLPVPREEVDYIYEEYREISIQKRTEDYLTEVCIVILCNALISTISSVSNIAILHNANRYEHLEIINTGLIRLSK